MKAPLQSTPDTGHTKSRRNAPINVRPVSQWFTQPALSISSMVIQRKAGCTCGGDCPECKEELEEQRVQPKLTISTPGDPFEQEADRVADEVMRMPSPQVQRACICGGSCPACKSEREESLQTKRVNASGGGGRPVQGIVNSVVTATGQPLDAGARAFMEPRFGYDFSGVRVHTDGRAAESARSVNARAYTLGRDVVFADGQYAPGTEAGQHILAHELTHTIQQNGEQSSTEKPDPDSHQSEHETPGGAARITNKAAMSPILRSPIQVSRDAAPTPAPTPRDPYWFQDTPPAKKIKTDIGDIEPKGQVVIQGGSPATVRLDSLGIAIPVQFAGMDSDFSDAQPKESMKKVEDLVLDSIKKVVGDLSGLPEVSYEWGGTVSKSAAKKKMQEQVRHNEIVRAKLNEAMRELSARPLNVFIATDLTVAEKMSLTPFALRTQQIYVRPSEYGDPSKLQAAIRIPLVGLLGGDVGMMPGGPHGWEQTKAPELTEQQTKEVLLHEMVHVFLIDRGASASQVWDAVGPGMVKGPQAAKDACENVIRRYLRAQEEVFAYSQVSDLYPKSSNPEFDYFSKNKPAYDKFIQAVDLFLASISANANQTKTIKLPVKERVAKTKVDWEISFKYPKSVTVTEPQLDKLKELATGDIGT